MELNAKERFTRCWQASIADNNLTLYGFRRFKTTHLVNLRYLEDELAEIDHTIYQAGIGLGLDVSSVDRLGLKHSKKDANAPKVDDAITEDLLNKMRVLLKEYDEAIVHFNELMTMETFALLDDGNQASLRNDLTLPEVYKTRLLRIDLEGRARTDPFQRWLHKYLRAFRYWRLTKKARNEYYLEVDHRLPSYQNTILIADVIGRIAIAASTAVFLITPLVILSQEPSRKVQLAIVSAFITVLTLLVSLLLKVSSFETMAVAAAYAAVLSVFVSNGPMGS